MKILLISDTHGSLPSQTFKYAENCDEIWHAGDVGKIEIISQLKNIKPFRGVYGNIDGVDIKKSLPEDLLFNVGHSTVYLTHIGGSPIKTPTRVKNILNEKSPSIFICGHSHIVQVQTMPQFKNCIYINPGAAGNEGFHKIKTFMLLEFNEDKLASLKVVELGKRGS